MFQHSLLLLLYRPMMKCPQGATNAEMHWLKCHRSVCLDKRARLDSLESLFKLESNRVGPYQSTPALRLAAELSSYSA